MNKLEKTLLIVFTAVFAFFFSMIISLILHEPFFPNAFFIAVISGTAYFVFLQIFYKEKPEIPGGY